MLTTSLMAAALLAGSAPAIAADGRIDAPEGFRARLPSGFRYFVESQGGYTYYRAADPAGAAVVSVAMGDAQAALQCSQTGEVEVRPGVRTKVSPLRTRRGLEGCVVQGRNDNGTLALAFLHGSEGRLVVVAGVARGPERADRLAREVAETVSFAPVPALDPRLAGCFFREASRTQDAFIADYFTVTTRFTRCFRPDRTYQASTEVLMTGRATGSSGSDVKEGRWSFRNGVLEVQGDESWTARVHFESDALVLDEARWERQREADAD